MASDTTEVPVDVWDSQLRADVEELRDALKVSAEERARAEAIAERLPDIADAVPRMSDLVARQIDALLADLRDDTITERSPEQLLEDAQDLLELVELASKPRAA
jgi:hypothetical protein